IEESDKVDQELKQIVESSSSSFLLAVEAKGLIDP
ncbi:hypothetical protein A2U01_0053600, partial [Trifolium medium]|nr:hypothetical protein [Trifolium medium]